MKKSVKIIAALCLMAALVLTLAACGEKDPVGIWECTNYQKDMIKDYQAWEISDEMSMLLILNADKTCYMLSVDGKSIDGVAFTWSQNGDLLTLIPAKGYDPGEEVYVKVDGDKLTCDGPGWEVTYVFTKK